MSYFPEAVSAVQILQITGSCLMMFKALSGDVLHSLTARKQPPVQTSRTNLPYKPPTRRVNNNIHIISRTSAINYITCVAQQIRKPPAAHRYALLQVTTLAKNHSCATTFRNT